MVCGLSRDLSDLVPHAYTISSLLLHRHRHRDRLQRVVGFVAGGGDDLVDDVHSPEDFAEDGVGSVQSAVVVHADKELRAVIIGVPRAVAFPWHLCHADRASFVRAIAGFWIQPVAGTAGPVQRAIGILTQRIAALDDKFRNDTVEGGSIIEPHLDELDKILDVTRSVVRVEANLDLAEWCCDRDARIDFLKLHGHDQNVTGAGGNGQGAVDIRGKGKGVNQDSPDFSHVMVQPLARVNFEPQESTHDGHGCGNSERDRPPPLMGQPRRQGRRNCAADIGACVHET